MQRRVNGPAIRDLRWERGLSQIELARRAEISRSQLCRVESGERGLGPANAKRIADALEVEISDITELVDEAVA